MAAGICCILKKNLQLKIPVKVDTGTLNNHSSYVPWNWHEPEPGVYLWEDDHDLVGFLKTAEDVGLSVILRAGPYICGEWDFVSHFFCCQLESISYQMN